MQYRKPRAIGRGLKGGIVMRTLARARLVVGIVCVIAVLGVSTCLANEQWIESGDPGNINPGMSTLEPTPVILSGFVTVLATVVSLVIT